MKCLHNVKGFNFIPEAILVWLGEQNILILVCTILRLLLFIYFYTYIYIYIYLHYFCKYEFINFYVYQHKILNPHIL